LDRSSISIPDFLPGYPKIAMSLCIWGLSFIFPSSWISEFSMFLQKPAFSRTSKNVFPEAEKSWEPAIRYTGIFVSLSFLNSAKDSFRISIGGYAESKRSPEIRMNSTCSWMHLSMIFWKDCRFNFCSSSCLHPPRWQSAMCANFVMVERDLSSL